MTRRKRYSAEFKREAIRRANEEGVTDVLVAEELLFLLYGYESFSCRTPVNY